MEQAGVVFIIPAYNEAKTLPPLLAILNKYGKSIVVDDGSTDLTLSCAKQCGAIAIHHKINLGYEKALDSGFKTAVKLNFEYAITIDADGEHDVSCLPEVIRELSRGCDLVLGVRDKKGRFFESLSSMLLRFILHIEDPFCGLKGYRLDIYKKFGPFCDQRAIGADVAIKALLAGKIYSQVKIRIIPRQGPSRFGGEIIGNFKVGVALIRIIYLLMKSKLKNTDLPR